MHDTIIFMNENPQSKQPIGIFDSGVGGLSVMKAIRQVLPYENIIYFGDQAHIPYGPRPKEEIRKFSFEIAHFLLMHGAKLIVVACNTASAAALHALRHYFQEVPFVGMEPAVKPAAKLTQTGEVGVLATSTTFSGDLFTSLVERFAQDVHLHTSTCPGLVQQIEDGQVEEPITREILEQALKPMLEAGIDTIVMGCTHYPFVIPLIQTITGPNVHIIDPAPAIARQTNRLLKGNGLLNPTKEKGHTTFYTSGEPNKMSRLLPFLLGEDGDKVLPVRWSKGLLEEILLI
ncbi:MAG: glutamate racemase [Anaerolineales bacterium]